ncbi:MAG: hypothetical protein IPK10_03080 [Bacteroidetes bacterium]|nr:hypothetical protein [Bacteroidota bacterium]
MAQKSYDFTFLAGPAYINQGNGYNSKYLANQFELDFKIRYTKRSSLLLGIGYLSYNKRFNYPVDTTVVYTISPQSSGPRITSHQIKQLLFFPINYDYQFIRKEKFDISIRGGFEFQFYLRDKISGSRYRLLPNGHLDSIPISYIDESDQIGSKYIYLAPNIGLNFRTQIKKKWYFSVSSSINFETNFNFFRFGVGVSYVQDEFKRTKSTNKKKKNKG